MIRTVTLALSLAALATPALARETRIAPDRYAVTVRSAGMATPAAARRTRARIERAALAACGASGFSLREVTAAVRASACWRDSMADTLTRIGDPSPIPAAHVR